MPSSVVQNISYDAEHRRLRIVYVSGYVYDYLDVPESVYKEMISSGSKGTFLNTKVKGQFKYKKVK